MADRTFALARQSPAILAMTAVVFPIPFAIGAVAIARGSLALVAVAAFMLAIWAFVWLWMRPTRFVVGDRGLRIEWPLRSETIAAARIECAEVLGGRDFRARYERGFRIGAGGLWGGFGLYRTSSTTFHFYVSRLDVFAIVHLRGGRPLLVTPERPEEFAAAIAALQSRDAFE